ncbi:hypothetical protein Hokovirus_1_8 [Hokovirus HKV1]|uniref:Uncharacterized protein n=1 Tax=Hokovirus HKV1 TaxID=1977638 RepID=A0A1V0SEI0_9VIRU|nr:hypothetical protein Hokovirus_1_8 [Hokovirus HKV1]
MIKDLKISNAMIIQNMFREVTLTSPFNTYYNNVKIQVVNNYTVYVNNFNNLKNTYDILNEAEYYKYNELPSPKYSTSNIPVYMKPIHELENMLTYNYYKKFNFGYIHTYNFNPTLFASKYLNNYNLIITPTITPYTSNLVALIPSNTAYDFFIDSKKLLDSMYELYIDLNKDQKYLIYNSLETGSLPELYHFHIQKIELTKPKLEQISKGLYKVINDNIWGNMYCFAIQEMSWDKLCLILPLLLFKCRSYVKEDDKYKYSAQIYLYPFDNVDYLYFSFKKNNVKNIKLNPDKYLINEYWQELYGNSYVKYNMRYLPVGIIMYNNDTNKPLIINDEVIKEIHSAYHYHPNIKNVYKKVLITLTGKTRDHSIIPYDYINSCISLTARFAFTLYGNKKIINGSCKNLPFLYKDTEQFFGSEVNTGVLYINGNKFYVINVDNNSDKQEESIHKIVKYNCPFIFPYYYNSFVNDKKKYMCFQSIQTNVLKYLNFNKHDLKHDFIHLCILVVAYNLLYLYQKHNLVYDIDTLEDLLVCDENRGLIDYEFNDFNYPIGKTLNDFKILHNGNNILFKFKNLNNNILSNSNNNININDSFKKFIFLLNDKVNNFNNLLLINIINSNNFNINDVPKLFDFSINNFAYRPPNYQNYNIYKNFKCKKSYESLIKCTPDAFEELEKKNDSDFMMQKEKLQKYCDMILNENNDCSNKIEYDNLINTIKNSNFDFFKHFEEINLPQDEIFVSGTTNNKDQSTEIFTENSHYFNKITYVAHMSGLIYQTYLFHLYNTYMKNTSFSRIIVYKSIESKIYKLKKPINTQAGNVKSSVLKIDYITHKDDVEFYEDYFEVVRQILFPEITKNNFFELLKIYKKLSNFDLIIGVFAQDLFNFCMNVKYPSVLGYTNYNTHDDMVEYIIFKPKLVLEPIAVIKPTVTDIKIFYNINILNNYFENLRQSYSDKYLNTDYMKILLNKKNNKKIYDAIIKIQQIQNDDVMAIFMFYIYYGINHIFRIINQIKEMRHNLFTSPILNDTFFSVSHDDINDFYINNF